MAQVEIKVSIVCPAFQEEEVLPLFHHELTHELDKLAGEYEFEIIYVDDGSRDRTLDVLKSLAQGDSRIRYLSLSRNFGHQAALTAGMEHARGDVIITMDSDLQHPPSLVPVLLANWTQGHDIVLTIRQDDPNLGAFKRFSSRWFYRLMGLISDTDIRLSAADYRLMSRKAVDALLQLRETHRFLRGMVQWLGFAVAEVPFQPAGRKAGVSKYTLRKMVNFAFDGMLSFTKLPLRFSLLAGWLAVCVSVLWGSWVLGRSWLSDQAVDWPWHILLLSIYFVGGCILMALGLVGEYVGRIFDQVKGRPLYLLKDQSPQIAANRFLRGIDSQPVQTYMTRSGEEQNAA